MLGIVTKRTLAFLLCFIASAPSYSAEMRRATEKPSEQKDCKLKKCTEKEKIQNQLLQEGKIGKERTPSIIRDRR